MSTNINSSFWVVYSLSDLITMFWNLGLIVKPRYARTPILQCDEEKLRIFVILCWWAVKRVRLSARTNKNCTPCTHVLGNTQRSALKVQWEPRSGATAFLITVTPVLCKYDNYRPGNRFYTSLTLTGFWDVSRSILANIGCFRVVD